MHPDSWQGRILAAKLWRHETPQHTTVVVFFPSHRTCYLVDFKMLDSTAWEAGPADLPSIGTIHARAFHPKNEWHRKTLPATMAPWWEQKYALDIEDPTCHVLKMPSPDSVTHVVGLLCLRKYRADERGASRWGTLSPPTEVNIEAYNAMIEAMVKYREQYMLGKDHFCVDHFGVDAKCQGQGLGTTLLGRACAIADREGLDIFVQANEFAESFYNRFGFTTEGKLEMPGGLTECYLVRRVMKG